MLDSSDELYKWKAIRSVTMKENFISTIVNFDMDNISNDVREKMTTR